MCKILIIFILCGFSLSLCAQTTWRSKRTISDASQEYYSRTEKRNPSSFLKDLKADTLRTQSKKYISSVNIGILNNNNLDKTGGSLSNFSFTLVSPVGQLEYYFRLKFNVTHAKGEYQSTNSSLTNYNDAGYYNFNGRTKSNRTGYTAGIFFGKGILSAYLGGGYGSRNLLWGIDRFSYQNPDPVSQSWAKNVQNSFSGPELEAGGLIRKGHFNMMAGINSIKLKYLDAYAGIGLNIAK